MLSTSVLSNENQTRWREALASLGGGGCHEVVMEKRSDNAYLVTGNQKHFPKEPFIVTAREMINILAQTSETPYHSR